MMNKTELYQTFEDILRNEKNENIINDMHDIAIRKEFDMYREIRSMSQNIFSAQTGFNDFRINIERIGQEFFRDEAIIPKLSWLQINKKSIAASILFLIVSSFGLKFYADTNYSDHAILAEMPLIENTTSRSVLNEENTNTVKELFMKKDYQKVISIIQSYDEIVDGPMSGDEILMLGSCYYHIGDTENALKTYDLLLKSGSVYIHEYYYNSIVCFLQKGDINAAKSLCKTALTDKEITNNYPFLQIDRRLSHPLRKLTN